MGINDYGGTGDTLNSPPLGGPGGWAEAVAAVLNGSDTTVDARISTANDALPIMTPADFIAGTNITITTTTTTVTINADAGTPAGGGDLVADGVTILATSATEWEPWQDTLDRYGLVSWDGRRRWVSNDWPGHTDPPDPVSGDLWDGTPA